ncbi:MAG: MATE family efflux transporter [Oscillospiraceae bacterium]
MNGSQTVANPLGTERVGKLLRSFAIPGVISMVINSLYNMVDQIFIGQGVGMLGNGATNIIAPISTVAIALASLFGDGLATYFSLQLGKGEPDKAAKAVGNSIISGSAVSILLTVFVLVFLEPLCRVFGATDNILPYALEYGSVIAVGFPFVIVAVIANGVVRADGSPKYSMVSMMIGSILNIILDPLFIFVFEMGCKGAALATIISQFLSMVLNVAYLFRFKNIRMTKGAFRFSFSFAGMLASLGIASCLNTMTSTIIAIVSNNMLTHYGALSEYGEDIPITVFGLCMKVSMLFFSVAMGISSASRPILGFNYGAEKFERVKKTLYLTIISTTIVMTAAWLVYQLFPLQLIRIFGSESELYEEFAVKCFRIYLLANFLGGIQLCAGTLFQAIGHPASATIVSLAKQVIFYVPAMLILAKFFGLIGILWAGPVSELLAFILAVVLMVREIGKMTKPKAEEKV